MFRRLLLAFACLAAALAADSQARAQITGSSSGSSTNSGSESINSGVANPNRLLYENGVCHTCSPTDVTNTPRPQNLNPEGVNFTDCEQNLRMDFTLILSGFQGGDEASVQVWAGVEDCTQDTNRVTTAGTLHACWQVAGSYGPVLATTSQTITMSVYARDVLRYSVPPASSTAEQPYDPTFNYSSQGESACHVQATDAAVPISIYFIPVNSTNNALGTAYQYSLSTDLVAPPPPTVSPILPGDTLLQVNWASPGTDPDIVGFAVYSDPPAGGVTTGGCSCGGTAGQGANSYVGDGNVSEYADAELGSRCMEAEVDAPACEADICSPTPDGATDGPSDGLDESAVATDGAGASDGEVEASMMSDGALVDGALAEASTDGAGPGEGGATSSDAGTSIDGGPVNCNPVNMGGSGDGGASSCADLVLTAHQFVVNGAPTTETTADGAVVELEASATPVVGDEGEDGGVTLSGGGISEIPPQYKAGEIDSVTATSLTLTGLTNGKLYHVAVTSIDGSGNVGPASALQCAIPAPTSDFWKTYKTDQGSATGCAFESGDGTSSDVPLFALGVGAIAAAYVRRRRTRR
jgi:hypothetical protein